MGYEFEDWVFNVKCVAWDYIISVNSYHFFNKEDYYV